MHPAKDIIWLDIEAGQGERFMLVDRGRMVHIVVELAYPSASRYQEILNARSQKRSHAVVWSFRYAGRDRRTTEKQWLA